MLVEPLIPKPLLLIVGGGHVGQAVAAQASLVGFEIVVIDDRPEFARPALFPDGHDDPLRRRSREQFGRFPIGADTYRRHRHARPSARRRGAGALLRKPAAYIGMIGSRRKVALMRQEFIESGRATAAEFDRVYAPIGLDIGAHRAGNRRQHRGPVDRGAAQGACGAENRVETESAMICAMVLAAGRSRAWARRSSCCPWAASR